MPTCKKLFFLTVLVTVAVLPLASDAQQGCYYSRNANYYTITKQQTITYYYYQMQQTQQAYLQQQQQNWTATYQQNTPTPQNRTATPQYARQTPQQRTATVLQQQQTAQAHTTTAINHTQTICSHTTPQLLSTVTPQNKTTTAQSHTATIQQCTLTQQQHTATAQAKTVTAQQKTATAQKQTATVQNKTQTAQQFTATIQQKTATPMVQTATQWEKMWGQKTITTTETVMAMTSSNCMQCHPGQQPTGVMTAQHGPRMPVGQQPGRFPMLSPRQQPYPMAIAKMPTMPPYVGMPGQGPQMVAKQPLLPQAVGPQIYRPPQMGVAMLPGLPLATPAPKVSDYPAMVRNPDGPMPRAKLDPLALTASATPKQQTVTIELVPVALEPTMGLGLRTSGRGMDVFDQLTAMQQTASANDVQVFVRPLSQEDLQQPPPRQLSAAVIQLAPAPVLPETLLGDADVELLLPVTPSVEPLAKRDPLELFGASPQPAPATGPRSTPAMTQPELPGNRDTELLPG